MNRVAILGAIAFAISVLAVPVARADPDFTVSPVSPLTGYGEVNVVGFDYTPVGSETAAWDLDGDGGFNDAFGVHASRTFAKRGEYPVSLQVFDGVTFSNKTKTIQVNGPSVDFGGFPANPVAGQSVTFVYTPVDPVEIHWDLDSNGTFDDASGPTAFSTFPAPAVYPVSIRVRDQVTEAVSTGTQFVTVGIPGSPPKITPSVKPRLMSPFPVIRITGKVSRKGARIKRLTVRAPYGSTIGIRCRGKGCPFRRSTRTLARAGRTKTTAKTVRIKKLERRLLHGGASIKVLVSRAGEVGKYTRFRIRRSKPPVRSDLCLDPGRTAPSECPS